VHEKKGNKPAGKGGGKKDQGKGGKSGGKGGKGNGGASGPGAAVSLQNGPAPSGIRANDARVTFPNPFGCFVDQAQGQPAAIQPVPDTVCLHGSQKPGNPRSKEDPYADLVSVDNLPKNWWVDAPNARGGYQYHSEVQILDRMVPVTLDGCAGCNSIPEELVVGMIKCALNQGIQPDQDAFPIAQLEKWPMPEVVTGIAVRAPIGGVVLRVRLKDISGKKHHDILVRAKICGQGLSDFGGLILGGRALDCAERGGLGHRTTDKAHVLDGVGIMLPRLEKPEPFSDKAYPLQSVTVAQIVSAFDGGPARKELKIPLKDETVLSYTGSGIEIEPGEGAWVPVKRTSPVAPDPFLCEVVIPVTHSEYRRANPGGYSRFVAYGRIRRICVHDKP